MYDTLLLLHMLGAVAAFVTIAMFTAYALGATADRGSFALAGWAWNVSGLLLLVFGIWLALYVDGYEIWDGWILGALVLFLIAGGAGARAQAEIAESVGDQPTAVEVTMWHWLRDNDMDFETVTTREIHPGALTFRAWLASRRGS